MQDFQIRAATVDDAAQIIDAYVAVGWGSKGDYVEDDLRKAMDRLSVLVAIENDTVVGVIRALSDNYLETQILDVVVDPKFTHKGIAQVLVNKMIEQFKHTAIYTKAMKGTEDLFTNAGLKARNDRMTIMAAAPQKAA